MEYLLIRILLGEREEKREGGGGDLRDRVQGNGQRMRADGCVGRNKGAGTWAILSGRFAAMEGMRLNGCRNKRRGEGRLLQGRK